MAKIMKIRQLLVPVLLIGTLWLSGCGKSSQLQVDQVFCNNQINPVGVEGVPSLRWIVVSEKNGAEVIGEEIRWRLRENGKWGEWIAGSKADQEKATFKSSTRYEWQVRVKDKDGLFSKWSNPAQFVTGLPDQDWTGAQWIGYEELPDSLKLVPGVHGSGNNLGNLAVKRPVVPEFRKSLNIAKPVSEALLFVSGLGQYTLELDDKDLTGGFMRPGWTHYGKTCLYNGYDLSGLFKQGAHEITITVGNGFFNINRERYRKLVTAWGMPMMRSVLIIKYKDGSLERINSDNSWNTAPSPITFTSIFGGEDYDARLKNQDWKPAMEVKGPGGTMRWESDFPLQIMETFKPVKITELADSTWVYDFGQNASGIPELTLRAASGQSVKLTPGELIEDNGQVTQRASGGPHYYDYTSDGLSGNPWLPRFTYYGFRYISLSGGVPAGKPNPQNLPVVDDLVFHHTRNSSPQVGYFSCSSELFNKIFALIDWSVRSNLASVTTDCPHREKLGWLEVTHLMGNSIRYNYDVHNMYVKIVDDMIESQLDNGLVPDIAPEFVPFAGGFRDSPEWGSSSVILPWYLYNWYGDRKPMERAYPMMKKYVDYLGSKATGGIVSHGLGDWFDLGPGSPGESQLTPMALTATAIYYYDLVILSGMAEMLGFKDDAKVLADSSLMVRDAFNVRFYNPETHVIATGSQTAYAMPLVVGLVPEADKAAVFQNLIQAVEKDGYALTAGDVGYHYLVQALQDAGASDVIYKMNSREDVPGYGFQLKNGATALTESWPALRFVSNNHMMLGHLMEWFYTGIGGIRPAAGSIGFEKIVIDPQPVGDLTWAEVSHKCHLGEIFCRWEKSEKGYTIEVRIPVGATADISFKGKSLGAVGSGSYYFDTNN
jgi:alpha-L-rhamnosidase